MQWRRFADFGNFQRTVRIPFHRGMRFKRGRIPIAFNRTKNLLLTQAYPRGFVCICRILSQHRLIGRIVGRFRPRCLGIQVRIRRYTRSPKRYVCRARYRVWRHRCGRVADAAGWDSNQRRRKFGWAAAQSIFRRFDAGCGPIASVHPICDIISWFERNWRYPLLKRCASSLVHKFHSNSWIHIFVGFNLHSYVKKFRSIFTYPNAPETRQFSCLTYVSF